MALVYLGLGSNMGDRLSFLDAAVDRLGRIPGTRVVSRAGVYETPPVGGPAGQGPFLNSACGIETECSPGELLAAVQGIERELGRVRDETTVRWGPRTIDVDILLWDDVVLDADGLTIPHPRLAERAFVLLPLAEIAGDRRHPVLHAPVRELLERIGESHEGIRRLSL